jgi:2,4-dienoyl-CoA reductase (NADPH2)
MTQKAGNDIGLTTRWTILGELKRLGVKVLTDTKAVGITPEGLEIDKSDGPGFLPADTIVIAAGSRSETALVDAIREIVSEVYVIGDAERPRNALEAIREGFETGLRL